MEKHTHPPFAIPGAYADMKRICKEKLKTIYGTNPPALIVERLDEELSLADRENLSSIYMLLHHLSVRLQETGGRIGVRGTLGSTLVSFLLEITDINPLPAHYRCPSCGYVKFAAKDSGYDLPLKNCPRCDGALSCDGHNIPYETCAELVQGKPIQTVDINVSASAWEKAVSFLVEFLGEERIACASEWNHPVCFMLLPDGMKFEDVTPITELTPPVCGVRKQTGLPGYELTPALLRVILLPHNDYDRIRWLHRLTGTKPEDMDYSDPKIYKLFQNLDTCGIPGFSTDRSKEILQKLKDMQFSDLVRVVGMTCGSGVWENNGEQLLQRHSFRDLIATRDDVFLTLRKHGIASNTAQTMTESVRKGKFCEDTDQNRKMMQLLLHAGMPARYVESMRKIHYLFPKAHAVQCARKAAVLAWFKIHYPRAFYYVSLASMQAGDLLQYSDEALREKRKTLNNADTCKGSDLEVIELLLEARRRKIFLDGQNMYGTVKENERISVHDHTVYRPAGGRSSRLDLGSRGFHAGHHPDQQAVAEGKESGRSIPFGFSEE